MPAPSTSNSYTKLPKSPESKKGYYQGKLSGRTIIRCSWFSGRNGLSELKNNSLRDTEEIEENGNFACGNFTISSQEVDDPTISTIEPDPCYEEEVVDIYSAEEGGD
jgi:hypothetical protein